MEGESHVVVRQFCGRDLTLEDTMGKCPSTIRQVSLKLFSAPVLAPILQDTALNKKKYFNPVCCIRLRVSTQDFYYYRLGLKSNS